MNSQNTQVENITFLTDRTVANHAEALKAVLKPRAGFFLDNCVGCTVNGTFCNIGRARSGEQIRTVTVSGDLKPYDLAREVPCGIDPAELAVLLLQKLKTLNAHLETDLQNFTAPAPRLE